MRDQRFVSEHRGGPLSKGNHILLVQWAVDCAEHVLHIYEDVSYDTRPHKALAIAKEWVKGEISVGEARNAAFAAHDAAREIKGINKAACEAARAAGHAVATVHMADHSLQAAKYALKAIQRLSLSVDEEQIWQNKQLHVNIKNLVLDSRVINLKK